jgi:GAF domain-containing protein
MANPEDERWAELEGGYRQPYDPRRAIAKLDSPEGAAAWKELWGHLYHQSDVGVASYAAVPLLVRQHTQLLDGNWQTYALAGSIELARTLGQNPPLPEWLESEYQSALAELGSLALVELEQARTDEQVGSMLGIVALSKGNRARAELLLELTNDELAEMIEQYRER